GTTAAGRRPSRGGGHGHDPCTVPCRGNQPPRRRRLPGATTALAALLFNRRTLTFSDAAERRRCRTWFGATAANFIQPISATARPPAIRTLPSRWPRTKGASPTPVLTAHGGLSNSVRCHRD